MMYFILILLLLAAIFGVLGAVLKVAVVIVLSIILAVVILGWLGWWAVKRQTRRYMQAARDATDPSRGTTGGTPHGSTQVYDAEGRVVRPELPE
jgi:Flp pilus assembly protein TadB